MGVLADDRPAAGQDGATQSTGLAIGALTCASSAARVQSKLNRLGSVTAAVNFATGKALVSFPGSITPGEPITAVDQAGGEADEAVVLRPRPLVSLLTAVLVVVPKMVPGLQITGWQWLSLALAEQTQPFPAGRQQRLAAGDFAAQMPPARVRARTRHAHRRVQLHGSCPGAAATR